MKLAILGLGHIGSYVLDRLFKDGWDVQGFDITTGHDLSDETVLRGIISQNDGILATTPFSLNKQIASVCNDHGKDYFDLTESVQVTDFVKTLTHGRFVTQCGLAPGMVSIIANNLAKEFNTVRNIQIMVGALPVNATNQMQYYRTWSAEGLINEYIHPCTAIFNGVLTEIAPLQYVDFVTHRGQTLEAATTSGGIGSLAETWLGRADGVLYRTLRWPGHWSHMKFLHDDLNMAKEFDTFVKLFKDHVPKTIQDEVRILITATGWIKGQYTVREYNNVITCTDEHTAIQRSTGDGVINVLNLWLHNQLPKTMGWIKQEDLNFDLIWNGKYNQAYREIT